jgi:hypothetical protein
MRVQTGGEPWIEDEGGLFKGLEQIVSDKGGVRGELVKVGTVIAVILVLTGKGKPKAPGAGISLKGR